MPHTAKFCGKCGRKIGETTYASTPTSTQASVQPQSQPLSPVQGLLQSKRVYDPDCLFVGTVRGISLVPGEESIRLYISTKAGTTVEIGWSDVKTIGDIILLSKKVEIPQPTVPLCPKCGKPITWISEYRRYYCYNCRQYI